MSIKRKKFFKGVKRAVREHRINDEINEPEVRLVDDNGANVISGAKALEMAREAGVDLVEIAKAADMPIVKIIDYGKFKFEKAKKDKENKKHQKTIQNKEVKMGPKIDVGDFDRKCAMTQEFLAEGDNVKITMRFRGRELAHTDLGLEKMKKMIEVLAPFGVVEKEPKMEGRMMTMVFRPKSKK